MSLTQIYMTAHIYWLGTEIRNNDLRIDKILRCYVNI